MTEQATPIAREPILAAHSSGWRLWFSRHNWPTWLGLCFILPLLLYYWQHYHQSLQQQQQTVFQQYANSITDELRQRLKHIELLLGANVAYVSSSEYVSQMEWAQYVQSLQLSEHYPGIQALGMVSYRRAADLPPLLEQINRELPNHEKVAAQAVAAASQATPLPAVSLHPSGDRDFYAIISHIQPATVQNRQVLGYDILTEPMRMQTALRAASLNQAAITAQVSLQQDNGRPPQPGLILMLPLYQAGLPLQSAEQKLAALQGFVYAAFRVGDILPAAWHDPEVALPDIAWRASLQAPDGQALFVRSSVQAQGSSDPRSPRPILALRQRQQLEWYGQPFELEVSNHPLFQRQVLPLAEYELVLLGSLALVLLCLLLSYLNVRRYQAEFRARQWQHHVQQQRQLLMQDEQRQSLALKASQLAWFEFDLRSGGAFYADSWWRMFDFAAPLPNPEPQHLFDLLHPSSLALFRQDLQRLLAHGPDQDQQSYRFISRQGRQLYCLVNFYVVRAPEGDAIRLCCTIRDQTSVQQQALLRQRIARLCQFDLSQTLALQDAAMLPDSVRAFLAQQLRWLLEFYCQSLAGASDPLSLDPLSLQRADNIKGGSEITDLHVAMQRQSTQRSDAAQAAPRLHPAVQCRPLWQLLTDLLLCYQPQARAKTLQLCWQQPSVSELQQLDQHRGWQVASALLELALTLANPATVISLDLQAFQTRLRLKVQLELTALTAQHLTDALSQSDADRQVQPTELQQKLQLVQFWASQLGGEFSAQSDAAEPGLFSLQLLLPGGS